VSLLHHAIGAAERGLVPDALIRAGVRRLAAERLRDIGAQDPAARRRSLDAFLEHASTGPIAPAPREANEQHYETPPEFFRLVLGPRLKYSGCLWSRGVESLAQAEEAALEATCANAGLKDGQTVLELGCGWGSLTLWMAERYPGSRITALSNSAPQRETIVARAEELGLDNLTVVTQDISDFDTERRFDRVVSVEMFEHMRNYKALLEKVARWLKPDGAALVHVFSHRTTPYLFETEGAANWMGRRFFTGGVMPSADLFDHFQGALRVAERALWSGTHYQQTAEAWLRNLDANRAAVIDVLAQAGEPEPARTFHRWRIFFIACAETFGYRAGEEWPVAHTRLEHAAAPAPAQPVAGASP